MRASFKPGIVVGALLCGLGAMMTCASQAMDMVEADKLTWQDYPGLPGVKFVVLAGNARTGSLRDSGKVCAAHDEPAALAS